MSPGASVCETPYRQPAYIPHPLPNIIDDLPISCMHSICGPVRKIDIHLVILKPQTTLVIIVQRHRSLPVSPVSVCSQVRRLAHFALSSYRAGETLCGLILVSSSLQEDLILPNRQNERTTLSSSAWPRRSIQHSRMPLHQRHEFWEAQISHS